MPIMFRTWVQIYKCILTCQNNFVKICTFTTRKARAACAARVMRALCERYACVVRTQACERVVANRPPRLQSANRLKGGWRSKRRPGGGRREGGREERADRTESTQRKRSLRENTREREGATERADQTRPRARHRAAASPHPPAKTLL